MKNRFADKIQLGYVLCVAGILSMGVNAAIAGEITGNGKSLKNDDGTLNGKSACAFSGREDDPESGEFKGPIAQSWGQYPKAVRDFLASIGFHPGQACNPTQAAGEPGD
jgi:hypothetical protein